VDGGIGLANRNLPRFKEIPLCAGPSMSVHPVNAADDGCQQVEAGKYDVQPEAALHAARKQPDLSQDAASSIPSAETHVTDVNGDHQHIQDRSTVRTAGIGASTSREPNAVRFAVLRR
jgi:hypothetical protein